MEPIRQKDWADIDVIVHATRAINFDRSYETVGILKTEMAMIPGDTILSCPPCVCSRLSGRNWTLCNTRYAVIPVAVQLSDTVPVYGSTIVVDEIVDNSDV